MKYYYWIIDKDTYGAVLDRAEVPVDAKVVSKETYVKNADIKATRAKFLKKRADAIAKPKMNARKKLEKLGLTPADVKALFA